MAEQPEEVLRFLDAINALEAIDDDAACAKAITDVLKYWPEHHARLRELRQQRVLNLKAQGKTWKEIGDELGLHYTRAQQIGAGLRGTKRPTKKDQGEADDRGTDG